MSVNLGVTTVNKDGKEKDSVLASYACFAPIRYPGSLPHDATGEIHRGAKVTKVRYYVPMTDLLTEDKVWWYNNAIKFLMENGIVDKESLVKIKNANNIEEYFYYAQIDATKHSGNTIVIALSLFRYLWEYPGMVQTAYYIHNVFDTGWKIAYAFCHGVYYQNSEILRVPYISGEHSCWSMYPTPEAFNAFFGLQWSKDMAAYTDLMKYTGISSHVYKCVNNTKKHSIQTNVFYDLFDKKRESGIENYRISIDTFHHHLEQFKHTLEKEYAINYNS